MKKNWLKLLALAFMTLGGLAVHAAEYSWSGVGTITYTGTGATVEPVDGDLVISFPASGTLSLPKDLTARVLVIGGGGAGGYQGNTDGRAGGGGGAGEMVDRSGVALKANTSYTITVGAGGTVPSAGNVGNSGKDSSIKNGTASVVSAKGGGGGGQYTTGGVAGGSGGGGGGPTSSGATCSAGGVGYNETTDSYRNSGGTGARNVGGGGGGAGGAGGDASSRSTAGAGGAGKASDITGESVTYAGGGGGGAGRSGYYYTAGTGGSGGGGQGASSSTTATKGTDGTGSGGGGGGRVSSNQAPGAGGSGIVIVRLSPPAVCRIGTTGYATLDAAIAAATAGQTITLLQDIEFTGTYEISQNLKITSDTGHTYKLTDGSTETRNRFTISGGTLTLENVICDGGTGTGQRSFFRVEGGNLTMGNGATLQNVTVSNASSYYQAIRVKSGTFTMNEGATIQDCQATGGNGGAICLDGNSASAAKAVINGGTITGNTAKTYGGAIWVQNGDLTLTGGSITGNTAGSAGGAIYVTAGTVNVSGSPSVTGNTVGSAANNIQPTSATQIVQTGALTSGANIGVSYPASNAAGAQFGTAAASYAGVEAFAYDKDGSMPRAYVNGALVWANVEVCQIGSTKYKTLAEAVAAAKDGDTIELLVDLALDEDLTVDKRVTITSEGNNTYTLTRSGEHALVIAGDVTLEDITLDGGIQWSNDTISGITTVSGSSTAAQGKSLITVTNGARLTLDDGATVQNFWGRKMNADDADTHAAIFVAGAGTLVINDGAVLKNLRHRAFQTSSYAAQTGGAVYSTGTVTMNGGTIQDCYSCGSGGAIYAAGGTVNVTGGTITGCAAAEEGGAIALANGAKLNVSGDPTVTNNRKVADGAAFTASGTSVNNVQPAAANQITLNGALTGAVGVSYPATVATGAQFGVVSGGSGAENFTADADSGYTAKTSGSALVWSKPVCQIGTMGYESLAEAVAAATDGDTIKLLENITLNETVSIDNNVTLDGNNKTISRGTADADLVFNGDVSLRNVSIDGTTAGGTTPILVVGTGSVTPVTGVALAQASVEFQGMPVTFAGGELITADAQDGIRVQYTADGTLGIPAEAQADYLVVGGGGSGGSPSGYSYGQGGAAGEVKHAEDVTFEANTYTIKVGEGGQSVKGASGSPKDGNEGGDSSITATGFESVTAPGGAGGTDDGNTAGASHTYESSITGTKTTYATGGDKATSTSSTGSNATVIGGGGQGAGRRQNSGAGADGIVVVHIKSMKTVHDCGVRAIGATESFEILDENGDWGSGWTVTSDNGKYATASKSGSKVSVTGQGEGWTTVRIENDTDIYVYTVYVSNEPHPVRFCEGDQVQIWYDNPGDVPSDWFLMINDTRYELNQTGAGSQMEVVLAPVGQGDARTYIIGTAVNPGPAEEADLVIISDGTRFYGYRMSCDAARTIEVGESVDMVCSTVATNTWHVEVDDDYVDYIAADCTAKEVGAHSTTATLTGLDIADETYVRVRDDKWTEGEHNAQGAVYTLKTRVTGLAEIPVQLSPGVKFPVAWGYEEATDETVYTLVVSNAQECLSAAITGVSADNKCVEIELNGENATAMDFGKTAYYTLYADDKPLVTYQVVSSFTFTMTVGQVAPGFLNGVKKTPWVTCSTDPEIVTVTPVLYNALHSGEAKALSAGDAWFFSTNAYWKAGYFGIHARVADTHTTSLSMPMNDTTNITFAIDEAHSVKTVSNMSPEGMVTVSVTDQGQTPDGLETAVITIKSGSESGPVTFQVASGYHIEYFFMFVDSATTATKPKVLVPGAIQVIQGYDAYLPTNCVGGAENWKAYSTDTETVTVTAATGAPGEPVTIHGVKATGKTATGAATSGAMVMVENDEAVYVYQVNVILPEEMSQDAGTINVGESKVMSVEMLGNVLKVETTNPMIATSTLSPDGKSVTTTGVQEGTTQIRVTTDEKVYIINVGVRSSHIDKHVTLTMSPDGTGETYSYTFDGIISYSDAPNSLRIEKNGNTLTFIPLSQELNETNAQVRVQCFVDGLQTQSELHYWFTIKELEGDRSVWQDTDGKGYISYSGASAAITDPKTGDLILVFTNADAIGHFDVPTSWNAKMNILAVGGGGAGGSVASGRYDLSGGGGGGAGGFTLVSNVVLQAGSFDIVVGKGGAGGAGMLSGFSEQGVSGEASMLTNGFGYAFASAEGGGGGGAPKNGYAIDGLSGGSGGGASWFSGSVGAAGKSKIGEGMPGAVPTTKNHGGGGGGAGSAGGADGSAGEGRVCDISGEAVEYSQGGKGGLNYAVPAADGAGPGFGGDGGSGGPGGSGADGIVIVRVTDVFRNIKVPIPGTNDIALVQAGTYLEKDMIVPRFVWEDGETFTAFDYEDKGFRSSTDAHLYLWTDAIESITGVTSVDCYESETEVDEFNNPLEVGVGYYSFSIRLKEGFSWEDGGGQDTYGSTGAQYYRWVVASKNRVADAAIDIYKTVSQFNGNEATVSVKTFSSPEVVKNLNPPNVLFLGSLCNAHGFSADVFETAINTIAKSANVDYYMFNGKQGDVDSDPDASGTVMCGKEMTSEQLNAAAMTTGNHSSMMGFYEYLYQAMQGNTPLTEDGKEYDYIVFSFDRALTATYITTANSHEADVVRWLKPFYDNNAVIWLVDVESNQGTDMTSATLSDGTVTMFPWAPGPLVQVNISSTDYWSSLYYWELTWGAAKDQSSTSGKQSKALSNSWLQYKGLMGLFDPDFYLTTLNAGQNQTYYNNNYETDQYATKYTLSKVKALTGTAIENQVRYDDADQVATMLADVIKTKPYNLNLKDKIVDPEKGLTLKSVTLRVSTNHVLSAKSKPAESDWHDLIRWNADGSVEYLDRNHESGIAGASIEVNTVSNLMTAVISNVSFAVLTDIAIDVVDDGKFRTSEDATYNQMTGKWDKNPNDGNAFAELVDGLGVAMNIEGEAETDTPWEYQGWEVTASVINGETFVNGKDLHIMSVGDGASSTVYYRANPGCRLVSVTADGVGVDIEENPFSYTFDDIHQNHHIDIVYEPFYGTVESSPVTNVYDGVMHFYDVTLDGEWDEDILTQIRYSLTPDGEYLTAPEFRERYGANTNLGYDPEELPDVGEHRFYFRVYAYQLGYGDTIGDYGWTWVPTGDEGADLSVILPRELLVRPEDSEVIYTGDPLPVIPFDITGFLDGEDASVLTDGTTNGWHVVSTYRQGIDGMGLYDTWVVDADGTAIWKGDSQFIEPDAFDKEEGLANIGNYYFVPGKNFQPVERIPLEIGDVVQGPGLDPENPLIDTGVDPAERVYDGVPTNITVEVTTKTLTEPVQPLKEGTDYVIRYGIGDISNPTNPPAKIDLEKNPQFVHAGTNVVWYVVEPINGKEELYFPATNYQYVTIYPREITLESMSETWKYDKTEHRYNVIELVAGELVNGDTLETNTTAAITHVGEAVNTFDYTIVSGDTGYEKVYEDYVVTVIEGKLTVTPANITIGDVTYPDDPTDVVYGHDPDTGKPYTGVEDAEKYYDGIPTNILVDVKVPTAEESYRIVYGTNTASGAIVWIGEEMPLFTNVCDVAVFFAVEPTGENPYDYTAVTNFARVIIKPLEVTVKADDKFMVAGDPQPAYTAQIGELLPADEPFKEELITYDTPTCPTFADAKGDYPIVVTGPERQGNYIVHYEPGTLHVVDWKYEIDVTGPGVLTWEDYIKASGADAENVTLIITVDGGEPMVIETGDTGGNQLHELVFGGETDIPHHVQFALYGVTASETKAGVENEVWKPYSPEIDPTLRDDPDERKLQYTVENLGTEPGDECEGVTRFDDGKLVTVGKLDENGVQTNDTVNAKSGIATKGTEDYFYVMPNPTNAAETVAGSAPTLSTGETARVVFTVQGDGEFRWDSQVTDASTNGHPCQVIWIVDGRTNQVYSTEEEFTPHCIHVTDEEGDDGATHVIELIFVNDNDTGDSQMYLNDVTFEPSATADEVYGIVINTDPPSDNIQEIRKTITITNEVPSGWMPVYSNGVVVALRSADGNEGDNATNILTSTITLGAVGTGEIKVGKITIPVKDDDEANPDGGELTIVVDGKVFEIPPPLSEDVSYTITTNDGVIVIENLVIKVYGDSDDQHEVTINYTRDAEDPTGNTQAVIEDIRWKTYGETDDGGASWLDGHALMIIDHDNPGDGWVYLAFDPELKVDEEIDNWLKRTSKNDKIKVKFGRTREECDAAEIDEAWLSDKPVHIAEHAANPYKIWIMTRHPELVYDGVGYWRIWIEGTAIDWTDVDQQEEYGPFKAPLKAPATAPSGDGGIATDDNGGARSVNVFGCVKVLSATTNTMIAVPWTWYSAREEIATDIPTEKLVKTTNLSEGDMLLQYNRTDEEDHHYQTWVAEQDKDDPTLQLVWVPVQTATEDWLYKEIAGSNAVRSVRGYGLWLVRKNPLDEEGKPRPFWLYGQSVTNLVESTVYGGTSVTNGETYTMLGNPYCEELAITNLVIEGTIGSLDRIVVPNGVKASKYLEYKNANPRSRLAKSGWCWVENKVDANGRISNVDHYDVTIPAGQAFWYVRRTPGELKVKWPAPASFQVK